MQTGEHTHALHGHHYSTLVGVVGGGRRVLAHRAQYPILDARTLQDFGLDDVVGATRLMEDHEAAYPVPLKVMHYQWTASVEARLRARAVRVVPPARPGVDGAPAGGPAGAKRRASRRERVSRAELRPRDVRVDARSFRRRSEFRRSRRFGLENKREVDG